MKSTACALILCATAAASAQAQSRNDPRTMQRLWYQANEQCRGGSGDDKATLDACDEREAYSKRLGQIGWCYGEPDQAGYQMKWHRCGRRR